jgi:BirA family transcriptional regulator, biotin operon repressor / biotin---[acetyl-CoA-carboxylase] ligase
MPADDRLDADALQAEVRGRIIGTEIVVLESTSSTNDSILNRLTAEAREGLVVFAEHQTAGRGQRGNRWESVSGKGLWFSILLRPKVFLREAEKLTTWCAQSVVDAVNNEFGLKAVTRPPNDIYIRDRKLAGVLVEMRAQPGAGHVTIAGIGINVNHTADDFSAELRSRATSVSIALGRYVDRQKMAAALLRHLDQTYSELFR